MFNNQSISVHALLLRMLTLISIDVEIYLLVYQFQGIGITIYYYLVEDTCSEKKKKQMIE